MMKNYNRFHIIINIPANETHGHKINRMQKFKNGQPKSIWFSKQGYRENVVLEFIAGEFCRLINPSYPKTRVTTCGSDYYIISKEIPGFTELQEKHLMEMGNNIYTGQTPCYSGLGCALILALILNEIDLKMPNLGINNNNQIIKIDHGWCFAMYKNYVIPNPMFDITPADLESPIQITNYTPYTWLNIIHTNKRLFECANPYCYKHITDSDSFRREVNYTILKFLLTPLKIIELFLRAYFISNHKILLFFSQRQEQLQTAALQTESFRNYLTSGAAQTDIQKQYTEICGFSTLAKLPLFLLDMEKFYLNTLMRSKLKKLISVVLASQLSRSMQFTPKKTSRPRALSV